MFYEDTILRYLRDFFLNLIGSRLGISKQTNIQTNKQTNKQNIQAGVCSNLQLVAEEFIWIFCCYTANFVFQKYIYILYFILLILTNIFWTVYTCI